MSIIRNSKLNEKVFKSLSNTKVLTLVNCRIEVDDGFRYLRELHTLILINTNIKPYHTIYFNKVNKLVYDNLDISLSSSIISTMSKRVCILETNNIQFYALYVLKVRSLKLHNLVLNDTIFNILNSIKNLKVLKLVNCIYEKHDVPLNFLINDEDEDSIVYSILSITEPDLIS